MPDASGAGVPTLKSIVMLSLTSRRDEVVGKKTGKGQIEVSSGVDPADPLNRIASCAVTLRAEEEMAPFYEFECTYQVQFQLAEDEAESGPPASDMGDHLDRMTLSIAEPYLRQTLTDVMSRSSLPVISLPTMGSQWSENSSN